MASVVKIGIVGTRGVGKTTFLSTLYGHSGFPGLSISPKQIDDGISLFKEAWEDICKNLPTKQTTVTALPDLHLKIDLESRSFSEVTLKDHAGEVFFLNEKNASEEDKNKRLDAINRLVAFLRECDGLMLLVDADKKDDAFVQHGRAMLKFFLEAIESEKSSGKKINKPVALVVNKVDKWQIQSIDELRARCETEYGAEISDLKVICSEFDVYPVSMRSEINGVLAFAPNGVEKPLKFILEGVERRAIEDLETTMESVPRIAYKDLCKKRELLWKIGDTEKNRKLDELLRAAIANAQSRIIKKFAFTLTVVAFLGFGFYEYGVFYALKFLYVPSIENKMEYERAIGVWDTFGEWPRTPLLLETVRKEKEKLAGEAFRVLFERIQKTDELQPLEREVKRLQDVQLRFFASDQAKKDSVNDAFRKLGLVQMHYAKKELEDLARVPGESLEKLKEQIAKIDADKARFREQGWVNQVEAIKKDVLEPKLRFYVEKIENTVATTEPARNELQKECNQLRQVFSAELVDYSLDGRIKNKLNEVEKGFVEAEKRKMNAELDVIDNQTDVNARFTSIKFFDENRQSVLSLPVYQDILQRLEMIRKKTSALEAEMELKTLFDKGKSVDPSKFSVIENDLGKMKARSEQWRKPIQEDLNRIEKWFATVKSGFKGYITCDLRYRRDIITDVIRWESPETRTFRIRYGGKVEESTFLDDIPHSNDVKTEHDKIDITPPIKSFTIEFELLSGEKKNCEKKRQVRIENPFLTQWLTSKGSDFDDGYDQWRINYSPGLESFPSR